MEQMPRKIQVIKREFAHVRMGSISELHRGDIILMGCFVRFVDLTTRRTCIRAMLKENTLFRQGFMEPELYGTRTGGNTAGPNVSTKELIASFIVLKLLHHSVIGSQKAKIKHVLLQMALLYISIEPVFERRITAFFTNSRNDIRKVLCNYR